MFVCIILLSMTVSESHHVSFVYIYFQVIPAHPAEAEIVMACVKIVQLLPCVTIELKKKDGRSLEDI